MAIVAIDAIVEADHRYRCLKKRLDLRIAASEVVSYPTDGSISIGHLVPSVSAGNSVIIPSCFFGMGTDYGRH